MSRHPGRKSFTLLELLVVVAIMTILIALVAPAVSSVLRGRFLTQASSDVLQLVTFARQSALAQNQSMEVRVYQYADSTIPGEHAGNPATGKFRAFQVFAIADSGSATPVGSAQALPTGIIADSGSALSPLLSGTLAKTNWSATDPQVSLPVTGTNYICRAFRMRPDGSTTLAASPPIPPGAWCLTLHNVTLGDGLATPPADFATIQIDPISGKVTSFRP